MARRKKTEKRELSHEDIPRNTRATARRLLGRMARQWWKLLLVAGAALLSSASFTAIPLAVGMGIDRLVDAIRAFDGSAGVVETAAGALGLPVLLVAAAALFSSLMSYVQQYIIATVGEELTLSLRQDVSAKLNRLPLRYFDGHKTGDIMSRVTNDLEKVSSVMQVGLMQLVSEDIPRNTRATARRLLGRMARQWWKLLLVAGAALLSSASFTAIPLAVGMGIDRLVDAIRAFDGSAGVVETAAGALGLPVLLVAAAALFSSLMSYVQQYIIATVGEELTLSLRQDVSAKLNRLPLRYFDGHKTGDIMSRVTNDLEKVSSVMQVGLMQLVSSVFTIALAAAAMVMLSPRLFLVVLVSLALSMTATGYVSALAQRAYGGNMAAMGALTSKVEELYAGNRVVKVFNRQAAMLEEAEALNEAQFRAQRRAQFADYAIYPAIRVLGQLGFIATAVLGGGMALGGAITLGTVQAFLQYVNQIAEPVTEASYVITSLQAAIAGAERVFALLDEEEERPDAAGDASVITQGHVEFRHVRFGYTPERTLIHDLNLEVHPNEMVAIVGPTGGGKTTLVNLLMRFYELDGGSISIDGQDITALPRGELRRRIGMVLQDAWLFEGTIAENIAYGRRDATREEIVAAARAACCDHFIRTLPQGYDTPLSGETTGVSQGQMQLLTIARAMLTDPAILVLDEATSSVDTRTEVEIQKAMARLMEGKTSFVIAHRLSTIRSADLILVVRDGDIVERGTHRELMARNGFYASLYRSQFEAA